MNERSDVTALLHRLADGHDDAADALWPLVYDELRLLADRCFRGESAGHTLQPTALVNEAFVRLVGDLNESWHDRRHFLAVAGRAMRRVLVDHARRRNAAKRGGGWDRVPLDMADDSVSPSNLDLLALDEALERLSGFDPDLVRLVELRFFVGLTFDDAAAIMGVAPITAKRMWKMAKGWLFRELSAGE
jgi:RNA polymerase sigma factor (TIGR02999 family)